MALQGKIDYFYYNFDYKCCVCGVDDVDDDGGADVDVTIMKSMKQDKNPTEYFAFMLL